MISALKAFAGKPVSLLLVLSSLFFAGRATAQRGEVERAAATLEPGSRAVVDRLLSLRELPEGAWKFHAGDLAHGEDVNLDDSSWSTMQVGASAPNEAVWFRQTVEVPQSLNGYNLSGARIWFQFHADANGPMPQIVYFNGRRVALGDDLEPIVLFDKAQPGEKAVVAVKLLHTVDVKRFRGASMRIDFAENRPNPVDLCQEFLAAADLLPSLAPGDASKIATLDKAIQTVDLKALDAKDQAKFDSSLKVAQSQLEALRPTLRQATFHLDGNAHIDAAWLWPWTETVDVVKRTYSTALQLMYEYPGYTFTQSAAAYNEWLADKYPDVNDQIKQRIKEGRWEIVGGMWVEPDLNLPDGESLVRQLLVGKRWYEKNYGVDVRIGWNPDSFGYSWQLPQIYKKSGVDYFVTQKMTWNDTNKLPFKLFWWQSPDGSKVLTYFPHDYVNTTLSPVRLAEDLANGRKFSPGMTELLDLYGIGDHGGGPTRAILDEGFHWMNGSQPPCHETGPDPAAAQTKTSSVTGRELTGCGETQTEGPCNKGTASAGPQNANETSGTLAPAQLRPVSGHGLSRAENAPSTVGASAPEGGCLVVPKYQFGSAQSYFSTVEKKIAPESRTWDYTSIAKGYQPPTPVADKIAIPTWNSELYLEYHRGIYTTQAGLKHNIRTSEEELLNAEKWSSLAWVLAGRAYPSDDLTEDWKKALFNQFHDLAAGSGIAVIYKDAQKDFDWVHMSTELISAGALKSVAEHIDTRNEPRFEQSVPVLIWNPLGWTRTGDVTVRVQDPTGKAEGFAWTYNENAPDRLLAQVIRKDAATGEFTVRISNVSVPGSGYRVLHLIPSDNMPDQPLGRSSTDALVLKNGELTIHVDKTTGCVTSVQQADFEALASNSCGNQLQFFKDLPKQYDAWNIDPGTLDVAPSTIEKADAVELIGKDTPSPAIRVTYHWQNSKFVQTITLKGDIVDIDNDIDWHESHVLLKAAFPLSVKSDFATYEIPYGTIERPTTRNNSWEKAQFEVPALRWADLSGVGAGAGADGKVHGLSVLNEDKYGYDAAGNVLRLTLLRSPKWPDPEADMGHHRFHYALYPHAGTWKEADTMRHGWEYDYPLQAVVTTAHPGSLPAEHSFASVGPENVILTTMKKAEDSNALIFRAYEWAGKAATAEFHVPPGATGATITNLMEKPEGSPLAVTADTVKVPIHPYEILTIRVDYPNGGTKQ